MVIIIFLFPFLPIFLICILDFKINENDVIMGAFFIYWQINTFELLLWKTKHEILLIYLKNCKKWKGKPWKMIVRFTLFMELYFQLLSWSPWSLLVHGHFLLECYKLVYVVFIPIVQVDIVSLIVKLIIFKWLPYFVWPHIWFVLSYDPWTWILGSRIQLLMWLDMGSLRSDSCRSSRAKVYTRRSKSLGLLV